MSSSDPYPDESLRPAPPEPVIAEAVEEAGPVLPVAPKSDPGESPSAPLELGIAEPAPVSPPPVVPGELPPAIQAEVLVAAVSQVVVPAPPIASPVRNSIAARLPNASVGKPYEAAATGLFGGKGDQVSVISLEAQSPCGLAFDAEAGVFKGVPTVAGEISVRMRYRLLAGDAARSSFESDLALTINPNPASLWKSHDPPADSPFPKAHTDHKRLDTPALSILAASLRGRSHAHEGKHRDDDFALAHVEATGWHIMILADGAGSAKFSRRGSQVACETASAHLQDLLAAGSALDSALEKLHGEAGAPEAAEKLRLLAANALMPAAHLAFLTIHEEAAKLPGSTVRDFATTIIAVIARRIAGRWFLASFGVGDGGAAVVSGDGGVTLLTQPDSGIYAGQTMFLTMPQIFQDDAAILARVRTVFTSGFRYLAVLTDGVTDPIFANDAAFADPAAWEDFATRLRPAVDLQSPAPGAEEVLLRWLEFPSPGNHDDRTIILAVPRDVA